MQPAYVAFLFLFFAISISGNTKTKLKITPLRFFPFVMIYHHACVFEGPLWIFLITADYILDRARYLSFFFIQKLQLLLHERLFISKSEYILGLMHKYPANLDLKIHISGI